MNELEKSKLDQFIGRIDEWKDSMTKWAENITKKLDTFATLEHVKLQQDHIDELQNQIEFLKKRLATQWWAIIGLSILVVCGELAVHRIEWFLTLFK